jgi:hypothetical protein
MIADVCHARGIPERKVLAHYAIEKPRQLAASQFEEAFALVSAPESALLAKASAK